ncbi:Putative Histone acetyltransferase-like protein [Rhizopus microsporus]|nr:Putative Histone acetyltransferase-like protein [Rhizopus microsporus]
MSNKITENELFPQLNSMTEHEKLVKIARHLPCDACSCQGWRPVLSLTCACGHVVKQHVDNKRDMTRRFKVALRIEELLEEKGKLDDFDYSDQDIESLRKQIRYNAETTEKEVEEDENGVDFLSEASSPSSIEDRSFFKRRKSDDEEDEEDDEGSKRFKADLDEEEEEDDDDDEEEEDYTRIKQEDDFTKDNTLTDSVDRKETPAMMEERLGLIEVRIVENDGSRESMILLTGLKNIFQKQLPKMPKEYIARLVYDRNHKSIALIRKPMKVIGGICYRPFEEQEFAEIVFCAIASTEQVKGYGSFLMNHLKDYISDHSKIKHYLTYADNYATGYFKKQGFTTEITLDKRKWVGYIKDYEGGTIMQCTTVPKVKYLKIQEILAIQKQAVYEKMKEHSTSHIVYPGIQMPMNEEGKRCIDPYLVPGVKESGWTPEMDALSNRPRHPSHYNQMRHLVNELRAHPHSWPFHDPVNADEVTDYYEVIKEPMDLTTLEQNVENDTYQTMDEFIRDVQKIFDNCRTYNAESTNYARCANRLEKYFDERLRVWTSNE